MALEMIEAGFMLDASYVPPVCKKMDALCRLRVSSPTPVELETHNASTVNLAYKAGNG